MLYSDLDDDQQRIYDDLVAAGVLPDRVAGRVPDRSHRRSGSPRPGSAAHSATTASGVTIARAAAIARCTGSTC